MLAVQANPMAAGGSPFGHLPPTMRAALREKTPLAQVERLLHCGKSEARLVVRAAIIQRLLLGGRGASVAMEPGSNPMQEVPA